MQSDLTVKNDPWGARVCHAPIKMMWLSGLGDSKECWYRARQNMEAAWHWFPSVTNPETKLKLHSKILHRLVGFGWVFFQFWQSNRGPKANRIVTGPETWQFKTSHVNSWPTSLWRLHFKTVLPALCPRVRINQSLWRRVKVWITIPDRRGL